MSCERSDGECKNQKVLLITLNFTRLEWMSTRDALFYSDKGEITDSIQ